MVCYSCLLETYWRIYWSTNARTDIDNQAQTPEQRKRNAKFAKEQTAKRGKPASEIKKKQDFKSPISPVWLGEFCLWCHGEWLWLGRFIGDWDMYGELYEDVG